MTEWRSLLIRNLIPAIQGNTFWEKYLGDLLSGTESQSSIHLAIFVEPFLQYVLDGTKEIESRFSAVRCAPYRSVNKGDVVVLKRTGGPVLGLGLVESAWFYELEPESWQEIRDNYARALCALDPLFWEDRKHAAFATLMRIKQVQAIDPIRVGKRDRRGWVVLKAGSEQLHLSTDKI
jgi:hypothetical protein